MTPTVSVIVTTHNYGRFLDQCIQSVLAQTYSDFELVVVNDGSTDNTEDVLARYAGHPRVTVVSSPGVGLAAACNLGIRRSHGRYFMRLDADDYLDPCALAEEAGALDQHPDFSMVYPDFNMVDERGVLLSGAKVPRAQDGACLLDDNPLAGGAMYRRSCYDAIGGYNEALRYQEDYDFWLRLTERFRAYGLGRPLLFYRQHAGSMSRNRVSRSTARRYVKRQYTMERKLLDRQVPAIVIPDNWPGWPGRSRELLCLPFWNRSLIELAVEQARACEVASRVIVSTDHPATRSAAKLAGAEIVPAVMYSGRSPKNRWEQIEWARSFFTISSSSRPAPSLIVLASPYCPLRHPERLREAIDTLLIHGCDLVVSLEAPTADGIGGVRRVVHEGGELMAVGRQHSPRRSSEPLTGYVELLNPEWHVVSDEESRRMGQQKLHEAEALKVEPSAYLRPQTVMMSQAQ